MGYADKQGIEKHKLVHTDDDFEICQLCCSVRGGFSIV